MYRYALKRVIQGVITVWFIATATFIAMHSVPGDPLMNERGVAPEIRRNLEERYGLDRPVFEQYLIYMGNMTRGDFGISFTQQNRSVNDIIREHFPVSATLGILAIVFAALWAARAPRCARPTPTVRRRPTVRARRRACRPRAG